MSEQGKELVGKVEYRNGQEAHSSAWGKMYVKGLEAYAVREGYDRDRHCSYTDYCARTPEGVIFTVFSQIGNKRGTEEFDFYICETRRLGEVASNRITGGGYGRCECIGNFFIYAHGKGTTKAPRLMNWWQQLPEKCAAWKTEEGTFLRETKVRYAFWCAKHLDERGLKDLPAMPLDYTPVIPQETPRLEE